MAAVGDRGAVGAAIHIELRANRAHRGVAARDIEGPRRIVRHLEQRLAVKQTNVARLHGEVHRESRARVKFHY